MNKLSLMKHSILAVIISSLLAIAPACFSREVQVLIFKFDVPDSWHVEGGGPDTGALFATGAKSGDAYVPPNIIVEACVPTNSTSCDDIKLPNPPTEFQAMGCGNSVAQVTTLRDGVVETRWVCETTEFSKGRVTAGTSIFRVHGALLYLGHLSKLGPSEVSRFLDGIAHSFKVDAPEAATAK